MPITLRAALGNLHYLPIHPGLFIHGIMLLLLVFYFIRRIQTSVPKHSAMIMIIGFSSVYFINLVFIEGMQFKSQSLYPSLEYTSKIFLLLFLSFYVIDHYKYFRSKADNILLINSIVIVSNIILAHHFHLGWQHYEQSLEGTYWGFLAGNDTSLFSFVAFGYALFTIRSSKYLHQKVYSLLIFLASIYSLYIISSKAIFVSGIILLLCLFSSYKFRKPIAILLPLTLVIGLYFYINIYHPDIIQGRLFQNYLSQISRSKKMFPNYQSYPEYILWLNKIAPERTLIAANMINTQFSSNPINIIFGYGVSGIYEAFGRPPMAHFFSIIGHYGLAGFAIFYFPQLLLAYNVVKRRAFDLVSVLFLSVFLYGSLGGFVYGVSDTIILYALLFSLTLVKINELPLKSCTNHNARVCMV